MRGQLSASGIQLAFPSIIHANRIFVLDTSLTTVHPTGSRQEAHPPHSQAPACHRRCLARCDQGAPFPATRGPRRCPQRRRQGGQGEEGRGRRKEEGGEGKERHRRTRPSRKGQQAGCQGRRTKGAGKDSLKGFHKGFCCHVCMVRGYFRGDSVFLLLARLMSFSPITTGNME